MGLTLSALLQLTDEGRLPDMTVQLIRRFGPLGILGVGLVCATGLLLSSLHIAQAEMLVSSLYGLLLTMKIVAVVLAVGLAGLHKFVAQRRIHTPQHARRFATTLQIEIFFVLLVFVGAALLTSAPPPKHQMAGDMPHQVLTELDTPFQALLYVSAIATGLAGLAALTLEWRKRY